jgi:hypothetical protein
MRKISKDYPTTNDSLTLAIKSEKLVIIESRVDYFGRKIGYE